MGFTLIDLPEVQDVSMAPATKALKHILPRMHAERSFLGFVEARITDDNSCSLLSAPFNGCQGLLRNSLSTHVGCVEATGFACLSHAVQENHLHLLRRLLAKLFHGIELFVNECRASVQKSR